jgi:hypothetical protein
LLGRPPEAPPGAPSIRVEGRGNGGRVNRAVCSRGRRRAVPPEAPLRAPEGGAAPCLPRRRCVLPRAAPRRASRGAVARSRGRRRAVLPRRRCVLPRAAPCRGSRGAVVPPEGALHPSRWRDVPRRCVPSDQRLGRRRRLTRCLTIDRPPGRTQIGCTLLVSRSLACNRTLARGVRSMPTLGAGATVPPDQPPRIASAR